MLGGLEFQSQTSSYRQDRRLERAREHVNKFWFPVNQVLVEKIRAGLASGAYELDLDFLLFEIKTDLALFTHCLRRVGQMMRAEGAHLIGCVNPMDFLRWAGVERLNEIISDDELLHSKHALEGIGSDQLSPLQKAIVSASAAEVISQTQNLNPEIGFSAGLLRQLGLILIAWNYPQVYHTALTNLRPGADIDVSLSQALGFSPVMLAMALANEWGLAPEFNAVWSGQETLNSSGTAPLSNTTELLKRLRKICEVSEVLARANAPDLYPQAEHDWQTAKREIVAMLGSENLGLIQRQVRENCENYVAHYPQLFDGLAEFNPPKRIDARLKAKAIRENPYLCHCPPTLRNKLLALYAGFDSDRVSRDNLLVLINEIIPQAGYSGGSIYVLDPGTNLLMPRVKIGEVHLLTPAPVSCTANIGMDAAIAAAFCCAGPILEQVDDDDGEVECYVAGVIGEERKIGVLYLEIPALLGPLGEEANRLLRFKAIRRALIDCLNL